MRRSGLPSTLGQLSSLNLVRGFVAVGRRMSITLAAEDLCLTQSAVSRQVRALEQALGVQLLVRGHRSISFTPEGERLFRRADGALGELQEVMGAIGGGAAPRPVTVACSIGVAGLWLLPRLARFLAQHQQVDLRISASNELNDLRRDRLDLAIRYCSPDAAPTDATRLFGETIAPVAHPSFGLTEFRAPQDVERQVLLEFDGEYRPWLRWEEWLSRQGWQGLRPKGVLRFNQYDQVVHAAVAGQGVALGRLELIGHLLAGGRLAPMTAPKPGPSTSHAYWLIKAQPSQRPEVDEVAAWIIDEAGELCAQA
jgi:LysR family glycine cleavage system transcriptional activator